MHIDPMAPAATLTDAEAPLITEAIENMRKTLRAMEREVKERDPYTTVVMIDTTAAIASLTREFILAGSGAPWTPAE